MHVACVFIYVREVTQLQASRYNYDIAFGWNPFASDSLWSDQKMLETFFPILVLLGGYELFLLYQRGWVSKAAE